MNGLSLDWLKKRTPQPLMPFVERFLCLAFTPPATFQQCLLERVQ